MHYEGLKLMLLVLNHTFLLTDCNVKLMNRYDFFKTGVSNLEAS